MMFDYIMRFVFDDLLVLGFCLFDFIWVLLLIDLMWIGVLFYCFAGLTCLLLVGRCFWFCFVCLWFNGGFWCLCFVYLSLGFLFCVYAESLTVGIWFYWFYFGLRFCCWLCLTLCGLLVSFACFVLHFVLILFKWLVFWFRFRLQFCVCAFNFVGFDWLFTCLVG